MRPGVTGRLAAAALAVLAACAGPGEAPSPALVPGFATKPLEGGHAPVNGIELYYEIYGPARSRCSLGADAAPSGSIPLVLLHGGGSDIDVTFGRILPFLARDRRVIGVDEQGHGRTSDRDAPVAFDTSADDVAALLRHLGVEQREFQASTVAQPVPPDFFERAVGESQQLPARVWQQIFQGFLEDDFSGELAGVRAPTLVLWGDRDSICTRAAQDAVVGAIAGSRLVVYEGTGHALHWEQPQRFAADLAAFVDGLPAAR